MSLLLLSFVSPSQTLKPASDYIVSAQKLAMSRKAQSEYEKGTRLLGEGNAQASINHFLRVVAEKPRYYGPYHNLGMAYLQLGEYDAAGQNFQKSIDLTRTGYAPSLYGLAMVLYGKEQFAKAEPLALRAFVLEPSAAGKVCVGTVQLALGHVSEAERTAHEAIQLDPVVAEAYLLLATIHDSQHDASAVVGDLQMYMKLTRPHFVRPAILALLERAQQALTTEPASTK